MDEHKPELIDYILVAVLIAIGVGLSLWLGPDLADHIAAALDMQPDLYR